MELFGVYGLDAIFLFGFAIFFYKLADIENCSKLLWTGLSIIVSLGVRLLSFGLGYLVLGQAGLYLIIAVVRAMLSKRKSSG